MSGTDQQQDQIDATAATWTARLAGEPLSAIEQREFDAWISASPLHAAAFEEAQAAWRLMGQVRFVPGAPAGDIVEWRRKAARPYGPPPDRRRQDAGWKWRSGTAAAAILVMVAGALFWFGDPVVMMAADYSTRPAERRLVELSDGSSVELGPASAIAVRYSAQERRVELLSGLAFFHPAPMRDAEQRPFMVEASNGSARALGTQFTMERLVEAVDVTVIEHDVAVRAGAAPGRQGQVVLHAGQSVRYSGEGLQAVRAVNVDSVMAWRQGRLVFDNVPLREVATELGRYRRGRIVIAAPGLASRAVSGVFDAADSESALDTICRELGVKMVSIDPVITILY